MNQIDNVVLKVDFIKCLEELQEATNTLSKRYVVTNKPIHVPYFGNNQVTPLNGLYIFKYSDINGIIEDEWDNLVKDYEFFCCVIEIIAITGNLENVFGYLLGDYALDLSNKDLSFITNCHSGIITLSFETESTFNPRYGITTTNYNLVGYFQGRTFTEFTSPTWSNNE